MARRKDSPQKAAMREMMRDMMSVLLEGALDEELDEELGYPEIACVDGLNGFPQAIEAVYPKTEIQQCIIHQIRNSKAAIRMYLNHRRQKAQKTHGKTSVKTEERSVSYEKKRENPCA